MSKPTKPATAATTGVETPPPVSNEQLANAALLEQFTGGGAVTDNSGEYVSSGPLGALDGQHLPLSQGPVTAGGHTGGAGQTPGPQTVSVAQFQLLQAQMVEQQRQFDRLMAVLAGKAEAEAELGKDVIPPHILMADWLINPHGVRYPATDMLRQMHKKFGLVPCDPPKGYAEKIERLKTEGKL